ncbi:septum formation initiator family protein [Arthrobacter sp. SF27]|nr:septum formation initiator family protein [Arthrobacter sp. SF27]NMR28325.1 septum formation initiator family protein [Arthrobacter sp. SF27]
MATRRPRVPRAGRPAGGSGPVQTGAGSGAPGGSVSGNTGRDHGGAAGHEAHEGASSEAKVIRADFGGSEAKSHGSKAEGPKKKPSPSEARAAERRELSGAIRQPIISRTTPKDRPEDGGDGTGSTPVPARGFSGRMLALAVVLVTITILLAPSVRIFIEQRSAIAALEREIAAEQKTQSQLEKELARWEDPEYIKQQARDRIFYVMPGETRYLVTGTEGLSESEEHASVAAPSNLPWVDALWDSVKRAATDVPAEENADKPDSSEKQDEPAEKPAE